MQDKKGSFSRVSAASVYCNEWQYRKLPYNPVYQDVNLSLNKEIWKWLHWLQVWDLWIIVTIRKYLFLEPWTHAKHLTFIIIVTTLFTGVLLIQKPVKQQDKPKVEILGPVNTETNASLTCQTPSCILNHMLESKAHVQNYSKPQNRQNTSHLLEESALKSLKENGCIVTESSVTRIVQDELEKYYTKKDRKAVYIPDIENIVQNVVNDELIKYAARSMNSIDSVMKTVETSMRKIVNDELAMYDADKLGIPDYALESIGGRIISASDTDGYGTNDYIEIFGFNVWKIVSGGPRNLIQPQVYPGNCWAFHGSHANVMIQLARPVQITAVTLEHIPVTISPTGNINSAPKDFAVIGLTEIGAKHQIHLGAFTYIKEGPSRQFFTTLPERHGINNVFRAVELWILSNHGNAEFTCVYRFRVHGQIAA